MIDWSEVHIDWAGVDVISKMTHIPTNTVITPNVQLTSDDVAGRQQLLEQLDQAVKGA